MIPMEIQGNSRKPPLSSRAGVISQPRSSSRAAAAEFQSQTQEADGALQYVMDVMVQTGVSPERVDPHVCLLALRRNNEDADAALVRARSLPKCIGDLSRGKETRSHSSHRL